MGLFFEVKCSKTIHIEQKEVIAPIEYEALNRGYRGGRHIAQEPKILKIAGGFLSYVKNKGSKNIKID